MMSHPYQYQTWSALFCLTQVGLSKSGSVMEMDSNPRDVQQMYKF